MKFDIDTSTTHSHRSLSTGKFYYLQTATWENTYRPEWKDLSVTEWATEHNSDENFMVKKILGKKLNDKVGLGDLIVAKEIVKNRFFVGLMNDMAESIRRFNIVLGVDTETNEKNKQCMRDFFGDPEDEEASTSDTVEEQKDGKEAKKGATDNKNSNANPKVCCVLLTDEVQMIICPASHSSLPRLVVNRY